MKILILTILLALLCTTAFAVPPTPHLQQLLDDGKVEIPYFLSHNDEIRLRGVNAHRNVSIMKTSRSTELKMLLVLVQFPDQEFSVPATFFDSLAFSTEGNTIRTYYDEVSQDGINIVPVTLPSDIGWVMAPHPYSYYSQDNGFGEYPENAQGLCEDVIDAIDSLVDFSDYDNDGDGHADLIVITHTGSGAEYTNSGIWSHQWGIEIQTRDGVWVSRYTMQPEYWGIEYAGSRDMTMGVYAHELGHGLFGLPDLYDTDGSSNGIGKWGLMAYGNWLGSSGLGDSPAHPCAQSLVQAGFIIPDTITATGPYEIELDKVYYAWTNGAPSTEYFLLERRHHIGFDTWIPREGLLIWHVDTDKMSNREEWRGSESGDNPANHYRVALEPADGSWDLEYKLNRGDGGDPFPYGMHDMFDGSMPGYANSESYTDGVSHVSVTGIVQEDSGKITAHISVSPPTDIVEQEGEKSRLESLFQNTPNPFTDHTSIQYTLSTSGKVTLAVYNVIGQRVVTLIDNEFRSAGPHLISWNGTNEAHERVATGVYFYQLISTDPPDTKMMILTK